MTAADRTHGTAPSPPFDFSRPGRSSRRPQARAPRDGAGPGVRDREDPTTSERGTSVNEGARARYALDEPSEEQGAKGEGAMSDNLLIENLYDLPTLEQEPMTLAEEELVDHWIATEPSSRATAQKHGRDVLVMQARRELARASNVEVLERARGARWWEAASAADRILTGQ